VTGPDIQVVDGQVTRYRGIRFGGVACIPATRDAPGMIHVAVRHPGGELIASLREGDTLPLLGQAWQVTALHCRDRGWHANLTRIA